MPKIIFINHDGTRTEVEAETGASIMRTAVVNDISGIVGECGGSGMCATCHCKVDPDFLDILPPMDMNEDEMLEGTAEERTENSRLSCQLVIDEAYDGIVVHIPARQS